jgi:hypothetical protein
LEYYFATTTDAITRAPLLLAGEKSKKLLAGEDSIDEILFCVLE